MRNFWMPPEISVVLPVYNGGRFVGEAVDSILRQTFEDFEFIIVDDGSTDTTPSVLQKVRDSRIRVIKNESNKGIVYSLNRGIAEARGAYIARMDSDDVALPDRFMLQRAELGGNARLAAVGGQTVLIDGSGKERGTEVYPCSWHSIRRSMFVRNPLAHGTVLMRRSALPADGPYDARFLHNEDYALWLRLAASHELANIPAIVMKRRIHDKNITVEKELELVHYRRITLRHAVDDLFPNPLLKVHLIRPWLAFHARRLKRLIS